MKYALRRPTHDYILIDNTGGAAAIDVDLVAHNASGLSGAEASRFILVEDVTDSQAVA